MTNEELDKARAKEAWRIYMTNPPGMTGERLAMTMIAARLAREGWTPPPPPIDPDVLAFREWWASEDGSPVSQVAYLAGARMAREREQDRAKALVEHIENHNPMTGREALNAYKAGKEADQ